MAKKTQPPKITLKSSTKGEETRAKIVAAAIELINEIGFEQLTYQKLADRVGLTQPALYTYFKQRIDILHACSQAAAEHGKSVFLGQIKERASAKEKLKAYLLAHLLWVRKYRTYAYPIFATYYFSATEGSMLELFGQIQQASIHRIGDFLAAGQREGLWKLKNPESMSRSIHSLVIGETIKIFHANEKESLDDLSAQLWTAVEAMIKGSSV